MQRKHKMTGCARFFIALIIIAPLAYLGAAYYNGQDGIQNLKNLLGIGKGDSTPDDRDTYKDTTDDLKDDLQDQEQEIRKLKDENEALRKENEELKGEIEGLKKGGTQ